MSNIQFLYPEWFGLLPVVILAYWLHLRGYLRTSKQAMPVLMVKHPFADELETDTSGKQHKLQPMPVVIISILLMLTLSQPVKPGAQLAAPPAPVDLMLIIDTSISMVLQDYELDGKPIDRMTMTQVLLDRFIQRYRGKRIGLVILGDKPHVLLQPSEDHDLARHLVSRLKTAIAGRQAALGDAIAVAASHIKQSQQDTRTVLVLISDAVLPMGNLSPIEGARRAAKAGATLHTIAVGSTHMQEQVSNSLIYEPADTQLLQQIAGISGGKSFHAVDSAAMDQALSSIEQQTQNADMMQAPQIKEALYIWPLGLAIVFMMLLSIRSYALHEDTSS